MTTGQDRAVAFVCPRCGGPMYKPSGSSFYWHATNNHPRCTITNIVDIPKNVPAADDVSVVEPGRAGKKKRSQLT